MSSDQSLSPARTRLKAALADTIYTCGTEFHAVSPTGASFLWSFDFRKLLLGERLPDIAELLWREVHSCYPCQVGGLETSAIGIVAALVMRASQDGVTLNGFYIRKSRKKDGTQRMIEGELSDLPVVLVDDGINSGKSVIRQLEVLKLLGKKVVAVCVMVRFRDENYYSYFRENGIRVISLFTLDDFPRTGGLAAYKKENATVPPADTLRIPFTVQWKFESSDPNFFLMLPKSAPALDSERVYVGSDNGSMWALNQSDGSVAWRFKTLFGAGEKRIFSSPAVRHNTVYFGSYDGNFYALDATTGKKKWVHLEADWIGSSPCVADDLNTVFIGLEFGLWHKQGGLAALNAETGEKRWSQSIDTLVHSSPAYSKRHRLVVVGSSSGEITAYDAKTGALRWTFKAGEAVRAGFAIDEKRGLVCFGSEDRSIYMLNAKTGALVHKVETMEALYSTPLVHEGVLYMGGLDKRVYAVDLDTGAVKWSFWTNGRVFASPAFIEGHLFIGSNDGRLYELDPATGKEISFLQLTERIVNKIAYNPTTKRMFVPTYANELYCITRNEDSLPKHD